MNPTRTGVLLIRVWLEEEPPALRARITRRPDVAGRQETVTVATDVDDVTAAVRDWLEEFLAGPSR